MEYTQHLILTSLTLHQEGGSSVSGSESPSPRSQQGQDASNGSEASTSSNEGGQGGSMPRGGAAGSRKGVEHSQGIGRGAMPVPRLGIGGFGDRPLHSTQQQVREISACRCQGLG